ncbi:unnamed protein product [Effrenium voratum]|nr:unnamed protein product [Effrenium voratum]
MGYEATKDAMEGAPGSGRILDAARSDEILMCLPADDSPKAVHAELAAPAAEALTRDTRTTKRQSSNHPGKALPTCRQQGCVASCALALRSTVKDLAPRSLGVSAPENLLEHLHCGAAGVPFFPVMESPPALESPVWWWVKLCVLLVYVVSVLAKASAQLQKLPGKFGAVLGALSGRDAEASFNRSSVVPETTASLGHLAGQEMSRFYDDLAYRSLTRLVAPFCFLTVTLSQLQEADVPHSLVYGGSHALPLLIICLTWLRGQRLSLKWRLRLWLLLAVWFAATLFIYLQRANWTLSESLWLNHMVFVTILTMALQLPARLLWASLLLHSSGFVALSVYLGNASAPSVGLQVFFCGVMVMFCHYSHIYAVELGQWVRADVLRKEFQVQAEKNALRAAQAEATACEEAAKAKAAQMDLLLAETRAKAFDSARESLMELLNSMCDAVVQVDEDMTIVDAGNLGLMLYQSSHRDLAGTPFTALLCESDAGCFNRGKFPLKASLTASYGTKIEVSIYVSKVLDVRGKTAHLLGILEEQELVAYTNMSPARSEPRSQWGPWPEPELSEEKEIELPESLITEGDTSEELELLPEERLQAMMAFLWTWPCRMSAKGCCETHRLLNEAHAPWQCLGGAFPLTASTAGQVEQVGQAFFWQTPGTVAPYLVTLLLLQILPGDTSAQFRWILGLGALPALLALVAALPQQEKPLTPKASLPEALSCPDVQRCLLGTAGSWFLFDTACYGTVIFTPQILSHIFGQDQSLVQLALHSILLMIFAIPATGLAVLALPRLGPRKLNAYGFVLQAALFATVAATYGLIQNIHSAVLTLLCALYFSLNWGPGLATYVLPIEVFPEEFRSTLHGFSAAAGKLGALVGAGLFPFIDAAYGVPAVMALQAVVCALGALLSYLCLGIDLGCAAASAVSDA